MADQVNPYVGAARAALGQGLGMGWGDEAEAWLRTKAGQGSYEDNLRRIRQEYAQYAKEYPFTQGALEFAGGAAPGVAMMFIPGGQAAGAAQLQRSTLGALGRLAAAGAATGAISGAGTAEEGSRLGGAGTGAVMGGALGVALPLGMRAGKGTFNFVRNRLAASDEVANQRALQLLSEAVEKRAKMTPGDIDIKMSVDRVLGVPSSVANVSPATARLMRGVAKTGGEGAEKIERALTAQREGARRRVYDKVRKSLRAGDYYGDEQNLVEGLRAKAGPAYEAAYAHGAVDDPVVNTILQHPTFQEAYRRGQKIAESQSLAAKLRGDPDYDKYLLPELYKPTGKVDSLTDTPIMELKSVPNVRVLDYVKRGLDDLIEAGYKGESSFGKGQASALKDLRNQFVGAIDRNVPAYRDVRKMYAGDMEVLDAVRLGYADFGRLDHEQIKRAVSKMSDAEKEAFRTGAARHLYDKVIGPTNEINAAKRVISDDMQNKLRPLFENEAQFKLFTRAMQRESELYQQAARALGGSDTAENLALQEMLRGSGEAFETALERAVTGGGFSGGLASLTLTAFSKAKMNEKTASLLADKLMSKDPTEVAAVVAALEKYAAAAAPKAVRASAKEAGAVTGTTSAIYPAPGVEQAPREMGTSDLEADIAAEEAQKGEGLSELEKDIQAEIEAEKKKEKP